MAHQEQITFETIQLLKDQTLGIGSYGKVCKAKCDNLLCAAKLIHETLFDPTAQQLIAPHREHRLPVKRFEQECEFLSTIRHPNIVQYLGIYQDPDTSLPALLMELMDDSLTHFLESSPQPIPYHIQINICHDIALAISFLHSNGIVHRDLSSNNVLLIGNVRAKVTDFGMARLGDQNPRATQLTFTVCPGTDVYMPPEAIKDKPVYTEKIDCFSFGVIIVQIVTQQFPKPKDRRKEIRVNQPGLPPIVEVPVPEIERRQNHVSEIDPNHPLKQVALDCLKDRDVERPSAQHLCERVVALKEGLQYSESVRVVEARSTVEQDRSDERDRELRSLRQQHSHQVQGLQRIIQSQTTRLAEKDQTIARKEQTIAQNGQALREKDETIAELSESAAQKIGEKERELTEKVEEIYQELQQIIQSQTSRLAEKDQTITRNEQIIAQNNRILREKDETIAELHQQVQQLGKKGRENVEIDQLKRELGRVNQQLEDSERVIAQFQRRIAELEQLRPATDTLSNSKDQRTSFKLTWREGENAPCEMNAGSHHAAVDGNALYIVLGRQIFCYTISTSSWSQLPGSPTFDCSSVIINNLLTVVGGYIRSTSTLTNQLFSLTGEGSDRRWTEEFPPMPTKRYGMSAVCIQVEAALIVAGGRNNESVLSGLQTIEMMNTNTLQWSTAAGLPQPLKFAQTSACGDQIYILGNSSMYTCSLQALLQSCKSFLASFRNRSARVWKEVTAPPVILTACVSIHDRLLTIGGDDSNYKSTTAIHMYNPATDSWEVISHMRTPRCNCIAAALPDNQLMVVGGYISTYEKTDSVELASIE